MGVRLVDNTEKVKREIRAQLAIRVNNAAQFFVGEAKRNANIDTDFMRQHIGQTVQATAASLSAEMRSLAPYSGPQDTGRWGNLFWTRAWLALRDKFKGLLMSSGTESAGAGVIGAAEQEYFGPMGRP